ncbi:hypothetical protein P3S67_009961 [Capsicum chacoense]
MVVVILRKECKFRLFLWQYVSNFLESSNDLYKEYLEMMPTMMEASPQAETSPSSITKETVSSGLVDHVCSNDLIEPPSSEELAAASNDQV